MIQLLTIDEVAKLLHCSARTVKRRGIAYVRDGNRRLYRGAWSPSRESQHQLGK